MTISDCKAGKIQDGTIIWLKTITDSMQRSAVTTVGEDKSGDCIIISAYNQVDSSLTFNQLQKVFPKEITIGIKNPYMRLWRDGISALRNDNPLNIVFKEDE